MNTITLPSSLKGFIYTNTKECITVTDKKIYLIDGELELKSKYALYVERRYIYMIPMM